MKEDGGEGGIRPPLRYAVRRQSRATPDPADPITGAGSSLVNEMAIRERVAGPRLQVLLEAHGHPFGAELDGDIDEPRFPRSR